MKKILSIALVLVLCLSLFAGCGEKKDEGPASNLANAKSFLEDMIYGTNYKPGDVMSIDRDKDVVASVAVDGVSYPIEWSISVTEGAADSVKIGESDTANHVKIDLPDVAETDILFSAIATFKDDAGNTETATFNYKMACTLGDLELLDKAYGLADGEKLSGTPSLTGDIVEIKTPYDATTKSISVVIQVGMDADKLVLCSGLMGDYVDGLVVGDNICVQGVLGKYNGVVGFESGCTMVYVNKADGSTPGGDTTTVPGGDTTTVVGGSDSTTTAGNAGNNTPTTAKPTTGNTKLNEVKDQAKILKDIQKLGENESLSYIAILTGKVLQVETRTDKDIQYGSVTLTFKVGDVTLECYQMKGNGTDKVKSGDTITVRGVIKNYFYEGAKKGKLEFAWHEASGTEVTLTKLVASAAQDLDSEADILKAAFALKDGESLQKDVTLTGKVVDIETPYDAAFENVTLNFTVAGKKIKCYRLKGNGADKVKEGDTITVTGKIKNFQGTVEFDAGCQMTKRVAGTTTTKTMKKVTAPKAGKAYKFGMVQENVNKDAVYYLAGGMAATYYLATTSSATAAIDVYLEAVSGGFHMYTMIDGKKTYINMVQSGTHINGKYQDTASTVYTFDEELKTIVGVFDGQKYVFGTNTEKNGAPSKYTTVGGYRPDGAFYCQFYEEA